MEVLINNIIEYLKQVAMPILFLLFIFFVTVAIRMVQKECRDKYFDEMTLADVLQSKQEAEKKAAKKKQ